MGINGGWALGLVLHGFLTRSYVLAFGVSAAQGMREIIGYAPVEPDGSLRVQLPAGVPLAISVLDADARRRGAHRDPARRGHAVSAGGDNPTDGAPRPRVDLRVDEA